MSWVKENKFVAGLIGVTAVLGGAIIYFGLSQGSAYEKKLQNFEELKAKYIKLEKAKPYPNKDNLEARKKGIAKYQGVINDVQLELDKYRPAELPKLSSQQFSAARVKMSDSLRSVFAGVTLPESMDFGFEMYADKLPKTEATGQLNYQLEATEWLLTQLAAVKPSALLNIYRQPLPVETGKVVTPVPEKKSKKKSKKKKSKKKQPKVEEVKLYELMPMELCFTANESAIREFLGNMVNSEKYFYAIRAVRVKNQKQNPPTEKDANFPAAVIAPAGGDVNPFAGGFPGLEEGDDAGAAQPAPVAKSSEVILKQVLGNEELNVQIIFDVVLFIPEASSDKNADAK